MNTEIEYGCLMVYLNIPRWNDILKYIDQSEIEDDGFETNPHVTVLYGFDITRKSLKNSIKKSLELLSIDKFPIHLTGIGVFENDGNDVLKFNVESDELNRLNKFYSSIYPNVDLYGKYNPHMTIAYMLPDTGKKYTMKFDKPMILYPTKFVYSEDINGYDTITHNIR